MSKTVLITGTSSGFGRDTAETLRRAGHTVYASMRGVEGKNREAAEALRKLGIKTVELDVSDDASVEAGDGRVAGHGTADGRADQGARTAEWVVKGSNGVSAVEPFPVEETEAPH